MDDSVLDCISVVAESSLSWILFGEHFAGSSTLDVLLADFLSFGVALSDFWSGCCFAFPDCFDRDGVFAADCLPWGGVLAGSCCFAWDELLPDSLFIGFPFGVDFSLKGDFSFRGDFSLIGDFSFIGDFESLECGWGGGVLLFILFKWCSKLTELGLDPVKEKYTLKIFQF